MLMLLSILATAIGVALTILMLVVVTMCFIAFPTTSLTILIGITFWIDKGFWAGVLAAGAALLLFAFISSYQKTHMALTCCISFMMCSGALSMISMMIPFLAPDGLMIIPTILLSLLPAYFAVAAREDDYVEDKNGLLVNLVAAVFYGIEVSGIVVAAFGGLSGNNVDLVWQWIALIGGTVVAFFILRNKGEVQLRSDVLDQMAEKGADVLDKIRHRH